MTWIGVNVDVKYNLPFKVKKTRVDLQDLIIDLDEFTELDDDNLFKFERIQPRSRDMPYNAIMAISVEMNLD